MSSWPRTTIYPEPEAYQEIAKLFEDWVARPDWFDKAKCLSVGITGNNPFYNEYRDNAGIERAKSICTGTDKETIEIKGYDTLCPVRHQCLSWALGHDEGLQGVWGGTSERERRRLRRVIKREAREAIPPETLVQPESESPVEHITQRIKSIGRSPAVAPRTTAPRRWPTN